MGQKLTTPLSLTLGHWKEVKERANNLSVEIRRKKWQTLCSSEWPTLDVGWPQDGTFNIDCILQVKERVFDAGRHPDQVPYVITWESLVLDPPALGGTLCDDKTEGPQCPCHSAHGSPSPVLPLPPLRKRKVRGKTKASPPAGGPRLD